MSYCTTADVEKYLIGYDVANTATSQAIEKAIFRADSKINSYLGNRYDVSAWTSGISGVSSDLLFYAGFSKSLQPDWEDGATGIPVGGVVLDTVNARAHFSAGIMLFSELSSGACLTEFGQSGCMRLRYQPDVGGAPAADDVYLMSARNTLDLKSSVRIFHAKTTGLLTAQIYSSGETLLHSSTKAFDPTNTTQYHIEYNFDLDVGYERIFVDGSGGSQGAVTGARLDSDACGINVGAKPLSLTTSFPGYAYGYITDIETFDKPQHLADFVSEIPIAKRVITTTPNTIPPTVQALSEQLAAGYATQMLSRGSKESMERGKQFIADAVLDLAMLRDGKMELVDASGVIVDDENDPSSTYGNTENYATTFNEDSPLNWKINTQKRLDVSSERL